MTGPMGYRIRAGMHISLWGFRSSLRGVGLYVVAAVGCSMATIITTVYVGAVEESRLLVISNPLDVAFYLVIVGTAVYLAVSASLSISRERDSGTLQVLFYGPVDSTAYILAKYIEQMLSFAVILIFYVIGLTILGTITNFGFSVNMILSSFLAFCFASNVAAFGVFVSSATPTVRSSVITLVALFVVLLGIQWGESFLAGLEPNAIPPVLSYANSFLSFAGRVLGYVSPLACMNKGMEAIALGDIPRYIVSLLSTVGYSVVLIALAIVVFTRKGVMG